MRAFRFGAPGRALLEWKSSHPARGSEGDDGRGGTARAGGRAIGCGPRGNGLAAGPCESDPADQVQRQFPPVRTPAVLVEKYLLPGAQWRGAALRRDAGLCLRQHGTDMRRHVVSTLVIVTVAAGPSGHQSVQEILEVGAYLGRGILLHDKRCRGMPAPDRQKPRRALRRHQSRIGRGDPHEDRGRASARPAGAGAGASMADSAAGTQRCLDPAMPFGDGIARRRILDMRQRQVAGQRRMVA